MKNFFVLIFLVVAFMLPKEEVNAQQVEREMVILEIATGTWCGYCPGAAMGADELVENGKDVAVIEYHGGDIYENANGGARINYYSVTGYPTSIFDGTEDVVGGSATNSMYDSFLPLYEQRKAIMSSFTLSVDGACAAQSMIDLNITVNKVADYSNDNLVVHAVITESHIPDSWGGLPEVNFVERLMLPNSTGSAVDFSSSDEAIVSVNGTLDATWNYEKLEVVIFIQDNTTKEILQGFKAPMADFTANFANDASLSSIENFAVQNCSGTVIPKVNVLNFGTENLTSIDINYSINGGDVNSHSWTGNLGFQENEMVTLPEVSFEVLANNQLEVELINPNGVADEYAANNISTSTFEDAISTTSVKFILRTDGDPTETTWEFFDGSGNVVASGGPYEDAATIVEANVDIPVSGPDCYTFAIYDEGGNGMTNGMGLYRILDASNNLIYSGDAFGSVERVEFTVEESIGIININNDINLSVYPNPATTNSTINFNLSNASETSIKIFDGFGKLIQDSNLGVLEAGQNSIPVSNNELTSGIYMIQLSVNNKIYSERIIIQ